MIKFILFPLLWFITGNFFVSLVIVLIVFYVIDRRFVGILPNVWRPFQLMRRASRAQSELQANPHYTSMKLELARIYMEQKKYKRAMPLLEDIQEVMPDSAEVHAELGLCHLKQGHLDLGESLMKQALELNPRVKFGDPYLRLAEALAAKQPGRAIDYIEQFKQSHSSSCEAYYRLGLIYGQLNKSSEAKQAFREVLDVYRYLPRYSRKQQRRWAWKARLKQISS